MTGTEDERIGELSRIAAASGFRLEWIADDPSDEAAFDLIDHATNTTVIGRVALDVIAAFLEDPGD